MTRMGIMVNQEILSDSPHKRGKQSKRWCFTYNNYREDDLVLLEHTFKLHCVDYIIGREVGESGTPHYQGYIECPKRVRPIEKFRLPKEIHWESAKGSRSDNVMYCSKDGDYCCTVLLKPSRQLKLIEPKGWQLAVLKIVESEPSDRTIHWFWESRGGVGKTAMTKYLVKKHLACVVDGRCTDIKHGLVMFQLATGKWPEIVIINIVRSVESFVSYAGIEAAKDSVGFSSKYDGGMFCEPCPHMIIFANFEPDFTQLSRDRWEVHDISTYSSTPTPTRLLTTG